MVNEILASAEKSQKPPSKTVVRIAITALVIISSVAALVTVAHWIMYRTGHVVVDDAMVQGSITRLGARLDGQVKEIFVEPGQRVTKGQVLVRLEDQHLQAAVKNAEAQLESATNELHSEILAIAEARQSLPVAVEHADSMRKSAAAELDGAKSNAQWLNSEFARTLALTKQEILAASQLDLIAGERGKALASVTSEEFLRDAAESAYTTAKLQLQALRVREAHLGVLQASVSVARAALATAAADLDATLLRAPDEGWVVERIVELGGSAKVGEPILSLWIRQPWVEAWVSEKSIRLLHIGSAAEISLDAFPGHPLRGRIESFGMLTDRDLTTNTVPSTLWSLVRRTALVPVRIPIRADNLRLQPGLSAVVGIEKDHSTPVTEQKAVAGQTLPPAQRFTSSQLVLSQEVKPIK